MAAPLALLTFEEVMAATGQNPDLMADSADAVASAIERATLKLENFLRTSFLPLVMQDWFHLDPKVCGAPVNHFYKCLLTNGCMRFDGVVTVSVADEFEGPYTDEPLYLSDLRTGVVQVPAANRACKWARVTYTSGFLNRTEMPREIRQALLCFVPLLMLSSSAATAEPKQAVSQAAKASALDAMAVDMLPKYFRRVGAVLLPMHSEYALYAP